ncbi:MAG: hypothetical protein ACK4SY_01770 [Pyrobaculum sp.]
MVVEIFIASLGVIGLILSTRDNIFASLLLTGLGVVVAIGTAIYLGAVAFILVALVYIVAALTLVIIAAATLGDVQKTVKLRASALIGLAVVFTPLLATRAVSPPIVSAELDLSLLLVLAVFIIYMLKMAVEISI